MPPPNFRRTQIAAVVQRVAALEASLPVQVSPSPPVELMVDPDLLEQMLINLVRNAVEAALEPQHPTPSQSAPAILSQAAREPLLVVHWEISENDLIITIEGNWPRLGSPGNLFVPV